MNMEPERGDGELDTRRLARRMRLYYTQDGLWDVCLGLCTVVWGLAIRLELSALIGLFAVMAVSLTLAAKTRLTYPRIGYARFRSNGGSRNVVAALVAVSGSAILALVALRTDVGTLIGDYFAVWTCLAIGGLIGLAGWSFSAPRYWAYGALIFMAGILYQWGGVVLWRAVAVMGVAIAVSGLVVLRRFLKENPNVGAGVDA